MPINSEWTNFSSEERAHLDRQVEQNMQLWESQQFQSKTAGRYIAGRTVYKTWNDSDAQKYATLLEDDINAILNGNSDTILRLMYRRRTDPKNGLEWIWSLAGYAMERKALTKKARKMCLDIQKRFSTDLAKAFKPNNSYQFWQSFVKWIGLYKRELKSLFKIRNTRDIEVGNSECFKVGGIIIHNSIGANPKLVKNIQDQIKKATRYIKSGKVSQMKKVLYGHAFLVNQVGGHNVLGFYNKDLDNVYVRMYQRGHESNYNEREGGYIQVLIHELGHRCYKRFIPDEIKGELRAFYNELGNSSVKKMPDEGEKLWFTFEMSNKAKSNAYFKRMTGRSRVVILTDTGKEYSVTVQNFLAQYQESQIRLKYPTPYSRTNVEEFFCETVSLYLMGLLQPKFVKKAERVFGIASDEPNTSISATPNIDEEKAEETEHLDLTDLSVSFIVELLEKQKVTQRDGKYIKSMSALEVAKALTLSDFINKKLDEYRNQNLPSQVVSNLVRENLLKSFTLGIEQGKFERGSKDLFLDVTELYKDNDKDNSDVEILVREHFSRVQSALFGVAEGGEPLERTLAQLVTVVGESLSREGISVDVSVVSDTISELLDSAISLSALTQYGARVTKNGKKYVFSNTSIPKAKESVDIALFSDYMENVILENLGQDGERIYTLSDLIELVDASARWGDEKLVSDNELKISAINEYFNSGRFKDAFDLKIKGAQYIITKKQKVSNEGGEPNTAPKDKGVSFQPMNELQTSIMKEVCALLKGNSGDLTASDVYKSMGDNVGEVSLRGFGRSMGKLVKLDYLCNVGKCQKGTIYKLSETGKEWCKINAPTIPTKKPAKDDKPTKENSVENALLTEMRSLYQLVQPKNDQDSTDVVVAVGRELKKSKTDKLNSAQVKKLSKIITKLNIDLSDLPLLKAQIVVGDSADDENVTPLVMELRKLYVNVRKAGVHKRSLTILTKIATKVKENDLNEIVGEDLIALQRLISRAELNSADYPLIFKVVEQTKDEDKSETDDFPSVTEVMKIILRIMGQNIDKDESASSIREKVNKFPNTNVVTKGLGRSMGALVRYGYLEKNGTSPSGQVYKGTNLLARWYKANTPQGEITDLGKDILRVLGNMPNVGGQTSKQIHLLITTAGADVSAIGVGRSMGKLAKEGWLTKSAKGVFTLTQKGQQWFYSDLAKS